MVFSGFFWLRQLFKILGKYFFLVLGKTLFSDFARGGFRKICVATLFSRTRPGNLSLCGGVATCDLLASQKK